MKIEDLKTAHKCEVCGQPVKIYSGKEGTNSYEGLAMQFIEELLQSTADRLPDIAKMMEGRSLFGGKVKEEMADEIKEVITPTFLKLEAKVKELKEALSDSASTNAEQAAELFECQQKNELMEAEKGELKDRIKNREEMIDSLEKAYLRLKDSYKSLQQKLSTAEAELAEMKEKIDIDKLANFIYGWRQSDEHIEDIDFEDCKTLAQSISQAILGEEK